MTLTSAHISFWVVFSKTGQTDSLAWTHPWVTMSNISPAHARLTSQNHCVLGLRFTGFAVYNLHMHVACALFTFHFVILYSQLLKKCRIYREKLTDKTHFYFLIHTFLDYKHKEMWNISIFSTFYLTRQNSKFYEYKELQNPPVTIFFTFYKWCFTSKELQTKNMLP
jgi:hypothetical protein